MKLKNMPLIDQARMLNPKLDILEKARRYSEEASDYIDNYMARIFATEIAEKRAVLEEIAAQKKKEQTEIHKFDQDEIAPFCNITEAHYDKCMGQALPDHDTEPGT